MARNEPDPQPQVPAPPSGFVSPSAHQHGAVVEFEAAGETRLGCTACPFDTLDRDAAEAHANRIEED